MTCRRVAVLPVLLLGAACGSAPQPPAVQIPATPSATPAKKLSWSEYDTPSLAERQAEQQASVPSFQVFHDFKFTDQLAESGIAFVGHVVEDAAKHYKLVHYDHGTGLLAADIDGDGRTDLYFIDQLGRNELWRNAGGGRFEDWTERAGVAMLNAISVSGAFGDIDNDGMPDLFVTTVRHGNRLFRNEGKGKFSDISAAAGVDYSGHSSGAVFFDYDRDGLLDLYVCNIGQYTTPIVGPGGYFVGRKNGFEGHLDPAQSEAGILYHNLGKGKFADVTTAMGLKNMGWNGDAAAVDFNRDGFQDLYLTNMQGDDHYFENQAGTAFTDRTAELFPKTSWGAMGVKAFDWDADGLLDLYTTDMHSDMLGPIDRGDERKKSVIEPNLAYLQGGENNTFGNSFYRGLEGGKFEEVSDRVGAENYWPWGLSVDDLNADGWDDAFITASMSYPWRYHYNSLLLNNRGTVYLPAEFLLGVEPRKDGKTQTPWFDLDCAGSDGTNSECTGKTGTITVMGALGSRSSALFDIEGDGDLDIVTNEFGAAPQVLVSDLSSKQKIRSLSIRLVGSASNRDGLGATVKVTAGGRTHMKVNDGNSGYLSHSLLPLYFGLGTDARVEQIEVTWPSGKSQIVKDGIPDTGSLTLTEPGK